MTWATILAVSCFATSKLQESKLREFMHDWKVNEGIGACRRYVAVMAFAALCFSGPVFAADYERGLMAFRAGDNQQALEQWQPLAQAGDANAQHAIGMMHEYGRGLTRDDVAAMKWYTKAAEQGVSEAQYRLGVFHENGWGVTRDAGLAAQWYEKAAQLGHTFAQHDLAFMYLSGAGVPVDKIQAYKWLKIASTQRAGLMTKHLRNVAQTMTADQIEQAEKLARAWLNSRKI